MLRRRRGVGLSPPHFIADNPALLEGVLQKLVCDIWRTDSVEFILAGDPIRKKIDFKEQLDTTHQESKDAQRDFSYLLLLFSYFIDANSAKSIEEAFNYLSRHVEDLFRKRLNRDGDPYSATNSANKRAWRSPATKSCYMGTFEREMRKYPANNYKRRSQATRA